MYEYVYATIYTGGGFFLDNSNQEHRKIIASYRGEGMAVCRICTQQVYQQRRYQGD